MKIQVDPNLMVRLMAYAVAARGQEFSGLGFCAVDGDIINVYDFVLFDVGNEVFTEIPTEMLLTLMERPDYANMKAWLHHHPLGDGKPGPHNWSGTDERTIQLAPLGGVPELVRWSVSMVLTPEGWVGRIDNHIAKKTIHLEVEPATREWMRELALVAKKKREKAAAQGKKEREHTKKLRAEIRARVDALDPEVLEELGCTREDLVEMALEQLEIYGEDEIEGLLDEQVSLVEESPSLDGYYDAFDGQYRRWNGEPYFPDDDQDEQQETRRLTDGRSHPAS